MIVVECRPWVRLVLTIVVLLLAVSVSSRRADAQSCQSAVTRISPCGGTLIVPKGATNQHQTFTVYDLTAKGQSFLVTAHCTGYVTSCSASPGTANINPNSSTPITVTYSVSNTGGSGQLSLTGNSVTGFINVNSQHRPAYVTLPYYNYDNVQPALCTANCFDKVVTYSTPPYFTMDTPRSVTLMYRSNTANPMVTVQVDAWDSSTVRPAKMSIKIHRPGGAFVTFTNGSNEMYFQFDTTIIPERLGAQFAPQLGDTLTGAYNYTAVVTSYWADSTVLSDSTPVRVLIENERSSVYGIGWTVAGQQTIHPQSNGDVVITDGAGAISYFTLNSPGCVHSCQFTSPTGDFTTLTTKATDSFGRHYDRRYPDGTTYEFLGSGALAGVYDKNGSQTVFWYDSQGRDSLITDPLGTSASLGMRFTYSGGDAGTKVGSLRWIGDPTNRYTWFNVDATSGTLNLIEDPLMYQQGSSLLYGYTYNSQHQLIAWSDRAGNPYHTSYDYTGKLATDSSPAVLASGTTQSLVTQYQSTQLWLPSPTSGLGTSVNPAPFHGGGPAWGTVIDPQGYWTQFTPDRWGQPTELIHVNIDTTWFNRGGDYYHMGGIPALITTYPSGGVDSARYNASGLLVWSRPAGQDSTRFAYGNNFAVPDTITGPHQASQVSTVDGSGNVTAVTMAGLYTTHFYPDSRGRDTLITDPLGHATSYHYDLVTGNRDSTLAEGNRYTKRSFDAIGRVSHTWANMLPHSQTTYDVLNRVQTFTSGVSGDTTRYFYDSTYLVRVQNAKGQTYRDSVNALGWRLRSYDPDSTKGYVSYAYDKNGNILTYTNRRNQSVTFTYDALRRPLTKGGTGVLAATYTYSNNGRVVTGSNAVAATSQYFAATGWLDSVVTSFPSAGQTFSTTYSPSSMQQLTALNIAGRPTPPTFARRGFVWDSASGLMTIATMHGDSVRFGYDGEAKIESMSYTGGAAVAFRKNVQHLIDSTRYTIPYGGRPPTPTPRVDTVFARAYGYDSLGRVIQQSYMDTRTTVQRTSAQFGYNAQGSVNDFKITTNVTCATRDTVYGYSCSPGTGSVTSDTAFQSDLMGNDTVISVNGTATIHSSYAIGNRILTHNGSTFSTDADGNIISRLDASGRNVHFGWSPDGLLLADTTIGNSHVMMYDYDAFGQLVRRSSGGTVQNYFLWNGTELLSVLDGTATHVVQEWMYPPDEQLPVATFNTTFGTIQYLQYDALGNPIGDIYNDTLADGGILGEGIFDPYGKHIFQSTITGWKGLLWEGDSTQLYYAQNRWYDPYQGRWLSQDPAGVSAGLNAYAYAGGDRVNGNDPSGLKEDENGGCDFEYDDCGASADGIADPGTAYLNTVHIVRSAPLFDFSSMPLWGAPVMNAFLPEMSNSGGGVSSSANSSSSNNPPSFLSCVGGQAAHNFAGANKRIFHGLGRLAVTAVAGFGSAAVNMAIGNTTVVGAGYTSLTTGGLLTATSFGAEFVGGAAAVAALANSVVFTGVGVAAIEAGIGVGALISGVAACR